MNYQERTIKIEFFDIALYQLSCCLIFIIPMAKGGNNRDTEEHNEDGRSGRGARDMGGNGHPKGGRREGGRGERTRGEGGGRRRERKLKVLNKNRLILQFSFFIQVFSEILYMLGSSFRIFDDTNTRSPSQIFLSGTGHSRT